MSERMTKAKLLVQIKDFLHSNGHTPLKLTQPQWKEVGEDTKLMELVKLAERHSDSYTSVLEEIIEHIDGTK